MFCINRLVWGKLPGYSWWPGAIISHEKAKELDQDMMAATEGDKMNKDSLERSPGSEVTSAWIKWFGENQLSLVSHVFVYIFLLCCFVDLLYFEKVI